MLSAQIQQSFQVAQTFKRASDKADGHKRCVVWSWPPDVGCVEPPPTLPRPGMARARVWGGRGVGAGAITSIILAHRPLIAPEALESSPRFQLLDDSSGE